MSDYIKVLRPISLIVLILFSGQWARTQNQSYEHVGDIVQIVLPATAGISTLIWKEPKHNGTVEFIKVMSFSTLTMASLKLMPVNGVT